MQALDNHWKMTGFAKVEDADCLMFNYKVYPCQAWLQNRCSNPSSNCFFSHFCVAERRKPTLIPKTSPDSHLHWNYGTTLCGFWNNTQSCPDGLMCKFAHGMLEMRLHPLIFRIRMCKYGASCRTFMCSYAHTENQLRKRMYDPPSNLFQSIESRQQQQQLLQSTQDQEQQKQQQQGNSIKDGNNRLHKKEEQEIQLLLLLQQQQQKQQFQKLLSLPLFSISLTQSVEDRIQNQHYLYITFYKTRKCDSYYRIRACSCNDFDYHAQIERRRSPLLSDYKPVACTFVKQKQKTAVSNDKTMSSDDDDDDNNIGFSSNDWVHPFLNNCPNFEYDTNCQHKKSEIWTCTACHTRNEIMYHPLVYKTKACSRYQATNTCHFGEQCAHYHDIREKREPTRHAVAITTTNDVNQEKCINPDLQEKCITPNLHPFKLNFIF